MSKPPDWSEERRERLRKLWLSGMSQAKVGAQLGCTRNAVAGQVHRMGLRRDASNPSERFGYGETTVKPKRIVAAKPARPKPTPPAKPLPKPAETVPMETPVFAKPWIERTSRECCWPVGGSGADTLYCCSPIELDAPHGWCFNCRRRGLQPADRKAKMSANRAESTLARVARLYG